MNITKVVKQYQILFDKTSATIADMQKPIIRIESELGIIRIELETEKAALTAQNFLNYVTRGDFTNSSFYRVVHRQNQNHQPIKIEVIQGGLGMNSHPKKSPPIQHQTTLETGLKHLTHAPQHCFSIHVTYMPSALVPAPYRRPGPCCLFPSPHPCASKARVRACS